MNLIKVKRVVAGLICLLFLSGIAYPAGLNVTTYSGNADQLGNTYKAYNTDTTTPLPAGSLVQIILGGAAPPTPANSDLISSGTLYNNYSGFPAKVGSQNTGVSAVNNIAGELDYNCNGAIDPQPGPAYVRIWNADTAGQGAFYNQQTGVLKGPGQSPSDVLISLSTTYKADVPPQPSIGNIGENLTRVLNNYKLQLTIPIIAGTTPYLAELASNPTKYKVEIGKASGQYDKAYDTENNPFVTPDDAYFVPGKYYIRVYTRNYFSASAPSAEKVHETLSGGGGGPVDQTWHLKISNTGVNTIAFPIDVTSTIKHVLSNKEWDGTLKKITVRDIIEAINAASLADINIKDAANVSVFGWYDAAAQKHVGLTSISTAAYKADGTIDDAKIAAEITAYGDTAANILSAKIVSTAQPYQVSVRKGTVDFTLNGTLVNSQ